MLFSEPRFFAFLFVIFVLYWTIESNFHRKLLLLLASYFFYAQWDWRFAIMLFAMASVDFYIANAISSSLHLQSRKLLLLGSVVMNMGVLGFFKYFNFFSESAISFGRSLGWELDSITVDIILPVGISFFTFQSLSYTVDIFRNKYKPVTLINDYLLSASFFPQLVAGPIVRPTFFLPQLATHRFFPHTKLRNLFILFLLGYIKKSCIADNISPYVDHFFRSSHDFTNFSAIASVWLYSLQIYCDFSGYTDMAIASAGLFGYKLVQNFDAPYLSVSIKDFWRRWHMSLSEWIKDYIYIPLGGKSLFRFLTYRNLLITMLLGGLWHGASWTFVIWGGMHGAALILRQEFVHLAKMRFKLPKFVGWFLTINFVCIAWIFFRADSLSTASSILGQYLLIAKGGSISLPLFLILLPVFLLLVQIIYRKYELIASLYVRRMHPVSFAFCFGSMWAVSISFLPLAYTPFIYFQF